MFNEYLQIRNLFYLIYVLVIFFTNNAHAQDEKSLSKITSNLNPKIFISSDYIFLNESLHIPVFIKLNRVTNELFVLDAGNTCIYSFTKDGKFINKFGRPGQGPGDLLDPLFFDIDNKGNIYVYEYKNRRISIFNDKGKYNDGFRLISSTKIPFFLTSNKEVVINMPNTGYYISVYGKDGEIKSNIGEVTKYNKDIPLVNIIFAEGWPFVTGDGNYYIFLHHMPLVKIFSHNGNLIEEKEMTFIPEFHSKLESGSGYVPPEKHPGTGPGAMYQFLYETVLYRDNKFYCLIIHWEKYGNISNPLFTVYELNEKLNILSRKILISKDLISSKDLMTLRYPTNFDFIDFNDGLFLSVPKGAFIIKYDK
jgi:hypothetical protein